MSHHTIPRPTVASRANEQVTTTSLLPLRPPPEPLSHPSLPCPPRDHRFTNEYTVTTHLIPAAFPRASPFIPVRASPANESKEERGARVQLYASELLSLQAQHEPDHSGTQPRVLWSAVNRYIRKGNGGGLTLLLLHANGLHKETFEPTLRHLLQAADEASQYRIDEVWALEAVQHGDAGLVNDAQDLGALFIWHDHARDILNFILHFLPETVTPSALPTYLPRVPVEVSEAREKRGFASRELVVSGHSFGGCAAVLAAHSIPAPFSGLVLVDPVIAPPSLNREEATRERVISALGRRSVWSNREEAYSLLSKSPFFGAWDPDVLRTFVDYALVEDTSGRVRLKCTNTQEAVVFADAARSIEAWSVLPQIDNRIAMKWIVPASERSILQSYERLQEAVWRRPENVTNCQVSKATHPMVQDSPREVAQGLHEFFLRKSNSLRSNL